MVITDKINTMELRVKISKSLDSIFLSQKQHLWKISFANIRLIS